MGTMCEDYIKCKDMDIYRDNFVRIGDFKDLDEGVHCYVKIPQKIITIDFDIKGEDGNKSFEKNLEAATKWPKTYSELSKSGSGIHLHYIYEGDVTKLSSTE